MDYAWTIARQLVIVLFFGTQAMQQGRCDSLLAGGTLVVMVPTGAGLIVAADSRLTIVGTGLACDGSFKITELEHVDRAALVVTGHSMVRDTRSLEGVLLSEFCDRLYKIAPKFDANNMLKRLIESEPALISGTSFDLPRACVDAVSEVLKSEPEVFDKLRGKNIFQVAVAFYDEPEKTSYIRCFPIDLASDGTVSSGALKVERFRLSDKPSLSLLGEAEFLTAQVFRGPGLGFLGERYGRFRNLGADAEIKDVEVNVAG